MATPSLVPIIVLTLAISQSLAQSPIEGPSATPTPLQTNYFPSINQAVQDCSGRCNATASCVGVTIYQFAASDKDAPPIYWCRVGLDDSAEDLHIGRVVRKALLRDKLPKALKSMFPRPANKQLGQRKYIRQGKSIDSDHVSLDGSQFVELMDAAEPEQVTQPQPSDKVSVFVFPPAKKDDQERSPVEPGTPDIRTTIEGRPDAIVKPETATRNENSATVNIRVPAKTESTIPSPSEDQQPQPSSKISIADKKDTVEISIKGQPEQDVKQNVSQSNGNTVVNVFVTPKNETKKATNVPEVQVETTAAPVSVNFPATKIASMNENTQTGESPTPVAGPKPVLDNVQGTLIKDADVSKPDLSNVHGTEVKAPDNLAPQPERVEGTVQKTTDILSPKPDDVQGTVLNNTDTLTQDRKPVQGAVTKTEDTLVPDRNRTEGTDVKLSETRIPQPQVSQGTTTQIADNLRPDQNQIQGTTIQNSQLLRPDQNRTEATVIKKIDNLRPDQKETQASLVQTADVQKPDQKATEGTHVQTADVLKPDQKATEGTYVQTADVLKPDQNETEATHVQMTDLLKPTLNQTDATVVNGAQTLVPNQNMVDATLLKEAQVGKNNASDADNDSYYSSQSSSQNSYADPDTRVGYAQINPASPAATALYEPGTPAQPVLSTVSLTATRENITIDVKPTAVEEKIGSQQPYYPSQDYGESVSPSYSSEEIDKSEEEAMTIVVVAPSKVLTLVQGTNISVEVMNEPIETCSPQETEESMVPDTPSNQKRIQLLKSAITALEYTLKKLEQESPLESVQVLLASRCKKTSQNTTYVTPPNLTSSPKVRITPHSSQSRTGIVRGPGVSVSGPVKDSDCIFFDIERFRTEILTVAFTFMDNDPSLLVFVNNSACVGVFSKSGQKSVRTMSSLFPEFNHGANQFLASLYFDNSIYLFDSQLDQRVWRFNYDSRINGFRLAPTAVMPATGFIQMKCEIPQVPSSFRVRAAGQASLTSPSCILFNEKRESLVSTNTASEAPQIVNAIAKVADSEFLTEIESIFAWLDSSSPSSMYVFGSNDELYRVLRDSRRKSWETASYASVPYDKYPF